MRPDACFLVIKNCFGCWTGAGEALVDSDDFGRQNGVHGATKRGRRLCTTPVRLYRRQQRSASADNGSDDMLNTDTDELPSEV